MTAADGETGQGLDGSDTNSNRAINPNANSSGGAGSDNDAGPWDVE